MLSTFCAIKNNNGNVMCLIDLLIRIINMTAHLMSSCERMSKYDMMAS